MIAIYLRVSTIRQEVDAQLLKINTYLEGKGIDVNKCKQYIDKESAKTMARPQLQALQKDMIASKITAIYFYSIDRLSRQGTEAVISFLHLAYSKNVKVEFVADQYLNHEDSMIRNLLITFLSEFAKKERERIVDRVRAGLAVAKAQGRVGGRPKVDVDGEQLTSLRKQGVSIRDICKRLNLSKGVVQRWLEVEGVPKTC